MCTGLQLEQCIDLEIIFVFTMYQKTDPIYARYLDLTVIEAWVPLDSIVYAVVQPHGGVNKRRH